MIVALLAALFGSHVAIAQEEPRVPVDASAIPDAWRRAIAAREVFLEVRGVGDWEQSDEAQRVLELTRTRPADESDTGTATDILSIDGARCARAIRQLRDHAPVRRLGAPGLEVTIALGRIGRGTRTLASIDSMLCAPVMPQDHAEQYLTLLSLVGPVLTVGAARSEARAGGPPYLDQWWTTVDVRTGSPVEITDVLDEQSLLEALRADRYLVERRPDVAARLATVTTFAEARAAIRESTSIYSFPGLDAFAFVDWDEETGTAGVRLPLPQEGCGMCPNGVEELGLRVRPRAPFREHLRRAARGRGHLLRRGGISAF